MIYRIDPIIFLTIFTPYFNELWNPVYPSDVIIDFRFFIKRWSESNYFSNRTKVYVFWRKKNLHYDVMVAWPPGDKKKIAKAFKIL